MESSIDIHVPELDGLLSRWRNATVPVASRGVPPHITLLYPWKPPPLADPDLRALEAALAGTLPFTLEFHEVRAFPNGAIYLALEDEAAPRTLTRTLARAFPDFPPYGGEFADPTPHLTVAKAAPDRADELRSEIADALRDKLPMQVAVHEIAAMVEDEHGWWSVCHRVTT